MRIAARILILAALLGLLCSVASAYYYWAFFPSHTGPFASIPAHFDLSALKYNTVNYFISSQGPSALMPGDSLLAVESEIQHAAAVWDGVASSSLRVHFGGVMAIGSIPQAEPGIDVVFDDDMPPGLLAITKPTFPSDLSFVANKGTAFVPILRSHVQLRSDFTASGYQQASYNDSFFLTVVHEFGHALGLQHTLTSSVMSTAITRATTKGAPITADDIAGISFLYPTGSGFASSTGSITGSVATSGVGLNLASVVALSTSGVAISGMTNPDGTYVINGVPPGQYYVYAHPLPPAEPGEGAPAGIVLPVDSSGANFPVSSAFGSVFYPGTTDWTQATQVSVVAGKSVNSINFSVSPRGTPALYAMQAYGNLNGGVVQAPPFVSGTRNSLAFYAVGATVNNNSQVAPGLNITVIGNAATIEANSLRYFTLGYSLVTVDPAANVKTPTPIAFAATLNGDLYVLPSAAVVVPQAPPNITGLTPASASDGTPILNIAGTNLSAASRVLFDGAPANLLAVNKDGSLTVAPPAAPSGYVASVEVINPDGLTSMQSLGTAALPAYTYAQRDPVSMQVILPPSVTANTDALVAIVGTNTHFADGQTSIGFGTSDITMGRVWVLDSTHLAANLSIGAGANPSPVNLTVASALELTTLSPGMQVVAAGNPQMSLRVPITNAATGLAGVPAGGTAVIATSGLPSDLTGWTLNIGGANATFTVDKNGVISATVPASVTYVGPVVVQLTAPDGTGPGPVIMQLDAPPPVVQHAVDNTAGGTGAPVTVTWVTPANAGDIVTLTVSGISGVPAGQIWLNVNGSILSPKSVTAETNASGAADGNLLVQFAVPASLPAYDPNQPNPTLPVAVGTGTRESAPFALNIFIPAPPPPASN